MKGILSEGVGYRLMSSIMVKDGFKVIYVDHALISQNDFNQMKKIKDSDKLSDFLEKLKVSKIDNIDPYPINHVNCKSIILEDI